MTQINWCVDTYILDNRPNPNDLLDSIRNSGAGLHTTKYIPLSDEQDYGTYTEKDCVILYGTHGYISKCKIPFVPGAYGLVQNMNCNFYYSYLPTEWMLNSFPLFVPFGYLQNNYQRLFELYEDGFFVRPMSGFKTFTGFVMTPENIEHELNCTQQLSSVMPDTMVMICEIKDIIAEYRFIIGNKRVIDGSEYRWNDTLDIRRDYDPDCKKVADAVSLLDWQPDLVYTCDVAQTINGPKIVELNSFSCAGLYACDTDLIVNSINEIAEKEFKDEL